MMSEQRECNKCDRAISKGVLFYHSNGDDDKDLCKRCYNKKLNKGKISEDMFQLTVYCLPPGKMFCAKFYQHYTVREMFVVPYV